MNAQDFQRNFQASYFGLILTADIRKDIEAEHKIDVDPSNIVPCTLPKFITSTKVTCTAILRTGPNTFIDPRIGLGWKNDMDEDRTLIRPGVPSVGMIQIEDVAVYLSRAPVRDTPRGYVPAYHVVYNQWPNEFAYNTESYPLIWNVFNKARVPWHVGRQKVDNGEVVSAAVDRFLSLGSFPDRRYTQIIYKGKGSIGFINPQGTPVLFPEYNTYMLSEYVQKISGVQPIVK